MVSAHSQETPKSYLTSSDVARLLRVSPTTVARWTREGRLGCFVTLGGHRRFERSAVDELRKSLEHARVIGPDERSQGIRVAE